jgi:hypothetical protein
VAGQPIRTQAQTAEFDEGFDRIFGKDRKPTRGRFVYRDGQAVNVDDDWTDAPARAGTVTEELVYGGIKATDGTDISSRKKHREYMKAHGLAMAGDYSDSYRQREAASQDRQEEKKIRAQVDRDVHEIFGG